MGFFRGRFPFLFLLLLVSCLKSSSENQASSGGPFVAPPALLIDSSTSEWKSYALAPHSKNFNISFDMKASSDFADAVSGLSASPVENYSQLSAIVRFYSNGKIEAYNGRYLSETSLGYKSGVVYKVEISVNADQKKYSVRLTPPESSPVLIANKYAFRLSANDLKYINLKAESASHAVSDIAITDYSEFGVDVSVPVQEQPSTSTDTPIQNAPDTSTNKPVSGNTPSSGATDAPVANIPVDDTPVVNPPGEGCDCGSMNPNQPCRAKEVIMPYEYLGVKKTVRFQFQDTISCGKFVSGRYWAAPIHEGGTLKLVQVLPAVTGEGVSLKNGLMKEMHSMNFSFAFTGSGRRYGTELQLSLPYTLDTSKLSPNNIGVGAQTIFKGISHAVNSNSGDIKCTNTYRMCEEGIFDLTLVSKPPGNVFAPPFFGKEKHMVAGNDFRFDFMPNLEEVPGLPSYKDAYETLRWNRMANANYSWNDRESHNGQVNVNHVRGYPGYWAQPLWGAVLRGTIKPKSSLELSQKRQIGNFLAQHAIDLYFIHKNGAGTVGGSPNPLCGAWMSSGGYGQDHLPLIVLGLSLIQKYSWINSINNTLASLVGKQCFGETAAIQTANPNGRNIPLFGCVSTSVYSVVATNKIAADMSGWRDASGNSSSPCGGNGYHQQLVGRWVGMRMAILAYPEAKQRWPSNASYVFDFIDRTYRGEGSDLFYSYCSAGSSSMSAYQMYYIAPGALAFWKQYYKSLKNN